MKHQLVYSLSDHELSDLASPVFITGPAYSGKTRTAELCLDATQEALVIGTAHTATVSQQQSIQVLQARRPACWQTIEQPASLMTTLHNLSDNTLSQILIDSINHYLAHQIVKDYHAQKEQQLYHRIYKELNDLCSWIKQTPKQYRLVIVSAEVASGVVPTDPAARLFRQLVAQANQGLAQASRSVIKLDTGIPLLIKSSNKEP